MKPETSNDLLVLASRWWPWKVCAFLLLAVALSYLDRQALSVVAPIVSRKDELDLDNAELGLLLSAFFWSFALMHLVTGWLFDRFNIRVTYALFVALWSLAQVFSGLTWGFTSLFMAPTAYVLWQRFLRFDRTRPSGATATASCCPPGTARRSCTLFCT